MREGERTMKAIRFHQHGGSEVLKYEDAPDPKILANEVLVKVKACALNHLDVWVRGGVPGWRIPMPHIVGSDISGEAAEIGSLVTCVKPGDRVLLCPASVAASARCVSKGWIAPAASSPYSEYSSMVAMRST